MEDLRIPRIVQVQQELEKCPKVLGPRPTWESSVSETFTGVWYCSEWRWWQWLANVVIGPSYYLLSPFWGWHRFGESQKYFGQVKESKR